MKKYNVFLGIRGPGGWLEVPSNENPIESINIRGMLITLANSIPDYSDRGIEICSVRVVIADNEEI